MGGSAKMRPPAGFLFPGRGVSVTLDGVMRLIGHLKTEETARTLSDFLYVQGLENHIEHDTSDGWGIWIRSEDHIEEANAWLASYRQNPEDPQFKKAFAQAQKLRQQREKEDAAYAKKVKPRAEVLRSLATVGFGLLTLSLIAVSLLVFALQYYVPETVMLLVLSRAAGGLQAVLHGEVWRLVTPIFLHFGILHILFNMLWLRDLGSMIEGHQGAFKLGLLVLGVASFSNLAQYLVNGYSLSSADVFGGMSGVVYGLMGYIWMRGRFDPASGLFLHPQTVIMMGVWAAVCLTGVLGPVANTVHFAGLGLGMAWGYLSSLRYR